MVYMEATTTQCVYCNGRGKVWGGSAWAPERTCAVCKGTGDLSRIHAGVVVPVTTTGVY